MEIYDCTSGHRLTTYAIEGEPGSGEICVNGAAAHLIKPHDQVISCSYVQMEAGAARGWKAIRIFVDEKNAARD